MLKQLLFILLSVALIQSDSFHETLKEQLRTNNPYPSLKEEHIDSFIKVFRKHVEMDQSGFNVTVDPIYNLENFNCNVYPPNNPTNARQLRPADIGIVMAMGDSITAGFGAAAGSIFTVFTEYRGLSWSIGGDGDYDKYTTIPNIIKKYNPKVQGFSTGTGKESSSNSKLNVAVTGARSYDILNQARSLISKLKSGSYDLNQWKLLTIFIGGNNLCDYCSEKIVNSPDNFFKDVKDGLDLIQESVTKTFVNLVLPVDVTRLSVLSSGLCGLLHPWECGCAQGSGQAATRKAFEDYSTKLYALAADPKYHNREDFAVSVQPFFYDTQVPYLNGKPDSSYFAPDCFHFSTKAHVASGVALWNNMFEKGDQKEKRWYLGEKIKCPGEFDFIN